MKALVGATLIPRCWLILAWLAVTLYAALPLCRESAAERFCGSESPLWRWYTGNRGAVIVTGLLLVMPNSCFGDRVAWPVHATGVASLTLCVVYWLSGEGGPPLEARPLRRFFVLSGVVTGRMAEVQCGMLLLAVAQRSAKVHPDGLGYVDMLPFHRALGWWCIAMAALHSLAFAGDYLIVGGWVHLLYRCVPLPTDDGHMNLAGLVNFVGVISLLFGIALGLLSLPRVRRAAYSKFYVVHIVASAGYILFACFHWLPWVWYSVPGIAFYAFDRLMARRSRSVLREVTARILVENGPNSIALLTWSCAPTSGPKPGHRWVSIRAGSISSQEWHPFSVMQRDGTSSVMIKGLGDWSESLCRLVASQDDLNIAMEGPFGRTLSLQSGRARNLLLIAGGVGVSPHADLLYGLREHPGARWESVTLLWAVRKQEYEAMSSHCVDLTALARSARVLVFVTDQPVACVQSESPVDSQSSPGSAEAGPFRLGTAFLLARVPAIACVAAAAYSLDPFLDSMDALRRNLGAVFVLEMATPILIALGLCVPAALGVALAHVMLQRAVPRSTAACARDCRGLTATSNTLLDGKPASEVTVKFAKPDLHGEMARIAEMGSMEVHVCGPNRMVEAARTGARALRNAGFHVHFEVHDPDM